MVPVTASAHGLLANRPATPDRPGNRAPHIAQGRTRRRPVAPPCAERGLPCCASVSGLPGTGEPFSRILLLRGRGGEGFLPHPNTDQARVVVRVRVAVPEQV